MEMNSFHPSLNFTIERGKYHSNPFKDTRVVNTNDQQASTWYNKPTDTGLIMNCHAIATKRYKRSVVSGFVHRINRTCSWKAIHDIFERAKRILKDNQYPLHSMIILSMKHQLKSLRRIVILCLMKMIQRQQVLSL